MKTTNTKRFLSAVLAILMVLATCPVIALAATAPEDNIPTKWDGNVVNWNETAQDYDTITDIPAFIQSGATYILDAYDLEGHLELGEPNDKGAYPMTILSEEGFAMFVILSNCPFLIYGGAADGSDLTGAAAGSGLLNLINGAAVTLAADLNLGNYQIAPIFWKAHGQTSWYSFTFDGAGHAIYNWNVTQTISDNAYSDIGFIGFYRGQSLTVKNLALMNQTINITTTEAVTNTVEIGGIVGGMFDMAQQSYSGLTVSDVIVDLDASVTLPKTTAYGDWWVGGSTYPALVGGIAGQLGRRPNSIYNGWGPKNVTITNTNIIMNGTTNTGFSCVAGITYCANANAKDADPKPTWTLDDISVLFNQSGPAKLISSTMGAALPANDVCTVGDIFVNFPSTIVTGESVVNAQGYDLADDAFWTTNATDVDGMTKLANAYPFSEVFATNAVVIADMSARGADALANKDALIDEALTNEIKGGAVMEVATADDLVKVATLANAANAALSIELTADIDMTGKTMPTIKFLKSLEGNGHVISNMTINRTLTSAEVTSDQMGFGGFCDMLGVSTSWGAAGGKITNVAFTNYSFTLTADSTVTKQFSVGGLFGAHQCADRKAPSEVTNVILQGDLKFIDNHTGDVANSGRLGTFGAMQFNSRMVGVIFNNCVFVGTAVAPTVAPFMEVIYNSDAGYLATTTTSTSYEGKLEILDANRMIQINNCYSISYKDNAESGSRALTAFEGNNVGLHNVALKNVYQAGFNQAHHMNHGANEDGTPKIGYENVVDANGNSLWYLDCFNVGDIANGKRMETSWNGPDAAYSLKQFQGLAADNAMQFNNASEWIFFADGTPIPAVFGENAEALSVKSIDTLAEKDAPINFMGAQLRVDKEGIRFVAEFDTERYAALAAGDGYTVEYGFLIIPTVAITTYGEQLVYGNDKALKIATSDASKLLAAGDARLNGITPATEGNKIMFAVMTDIPAEVLKSNTSFTVVPYIAFVYNGGAAVIYGAEKEYNGVALANLACAADSVESAQTIAAIKAQFDGVEGFAPEQ